MKDPATKFSKHWPSLRQYLASKLSHLSFARSLIEIIYVPAVIYIS